MKADVTGYATLVDQLFYEKALSSVALGRRFGVTRQHISDVRLGKKSPSRRLRAGFAAVGIPETAWGKPPTKTRPPPATGSRKAEHRGEHGGNGADADHDPAVDGEHGDHGEHDDHESAHTDDDGLKLDAPGGGRAAMLAQLRIIGQHRRRAERRSDDGAWMRLVDLERKALVEFARLNGELTPADEARLTASARWQAIRAAIANALAPNPQAAEAVEKALAAIDA